jgi:hypothetical protein
MTGTFRVSGLATDQASWKSTPSGTKIAWETVNIETQTLGEGAACI